MITIFLHSPFPWCFNSGTVRVLYSTAGFTDRKRPMDLLQKKHYSLLKTSCQFPVAGVYYLFK